MQCIALPSLIIALILSYDDTRFNTSVDEYTGITRAMDRGLMWARLNVLPMVLLPRMESN